MEQFIRAASVLPSALRERALSIAPADRQWAEEIRLRAGRAPTVLTARGEIRISEEPVTTEELQRTVEIATSASAHSYLCRLQSGFIPLEGGCRLGVCGETVIKNGEIVNLKNISSLAVRIARERKGAAKPVLPELLRGGRVVNTLILSPPGGGKTTLLRDLVRLLSDGEGCEPHRVSLADERYEVAAVREGMPTLDVGERTDVLAGCPKAEAVIMLLRAMNPQVVAADEVTAPEDAAALQSAAGCGAAILATAHGENLDSLRRRPVYRALLAEGTFERVVLIKKDGAERKYEVTELA